MGEKMSVGTLEELLIDELKDLYSAEKQIVRALPKIIKAVSAPELQQGLANHLEETKGQVARAGEDRRNPGEEDDRKNVRRYERRS
jgi:ferritin-like metal-binding protein YciE